MKKHTNDPIVAEVRAIRAEQAARCGNDIDAIISRAQAMQAASGRFYVRYPARRLTASAPQEPRTGVSPPQQEAPSATD